MQIPLYQVDAFTNKTFGGNPAAVCPLETWLDDSLMQNIAAENNLSETVFFVPNDNGFKIRWFTPTTEVDLCGHATLATAYVIFEELNYDRDTIHFDSKSGALKVHKTDDGFMMDFPAWNYEEISEHAALSDALGVKPTALFKATDYIALFDDIETVKALSPDMTKLARLTEMRGVITTAKGTGDIDFVSRWFGPQVGVPEDPVTGSAHCVLTPFWAKRLEKTSLTAQQISARVGDLQCKLKENRVEITGKAKLFLKGEIYV